MKKKDELSNQDSCLNRARDDEWVFVLLGRDAAAAKTIRFWAEQRILLGKNSVEDPQIIEALACADAIEVGA